MSTRGVIAVDRGDRLAGRYLHWGRPDDAREQLARILARDGFDEAVRVLIDEHEGWSVVDASQVLGAGTATLAPVAGYGMAYVDAALGDPMSPARFDHEHIYVLTPAGVRVEAAKP